MYNNINQGYINDNNIGFSSSASPLRVSVRCVVVLFIRLLFANVKLKHNAGAGIGIWKRWMRRRFRIYANAWIWVYALKLRRGLDEGGRASAKKGINCNFLFKCK